MELHVKQPGGKGRKMRPWYPRHGDLECFAHEIDRRLCLIFSVSHLTLETKRDIPSSETEGGFEVNYLLRDFLRPGDSQEKGLQRKG